MTTTSATNPTGALATDAAGWAVVAVVSAALLAVNSLRLTGTGQLWPTISMDAVAIAALPSFSILLQRSRRVAVARPATAAATAAAPAAVAPGRAEGQPVVVRHARYRPVMADLSRSPELGGWIGVTATVAGGGVRVRAHRQYRDLAAELLVPWSRVDMVEMERRPGRRASSRFDLLLADGSTLNLEVGGARRARRLLERYVEGGASPASA